MNWISAIAGMFGNLLRIAWEYWFIRDSTINQIENTALRISLELHKEYEQESLDHCANNHDAVDRMRDGRF